MLGVTDNRKPHRGGGLCAPERWCFRLNTDGPDAEWETLKGRHM